MDLLSYVQKASESEINEEYLNKIVNYPPPQLETEKTELKTRISYLETKETQSLNNNINAFTNIQKTMHSIRDFSRDLLQFSENSVESALAVLKPSEHPYESLQTLLKEDVQVFEQVNLINELVNMPNSIKDAVMDGDFNLAFDQTQLVSKLHTRYPHSQLVSLVFAEVQRGMEGLKSTLLRSLSESSKLALLTKAVSHLRRLDIPDLKSQYVESRWVFMQNLLNAIPKQLKRTQPFAYLKRVIEIYREHIFATINGVNTIFPHPNAPDQTDAKESLKDANCLNQFARNAIKLLINILEQNTCNITDTIERSSLFLQLAFCSSSLGRVHCDFWDLLNTKILTNREWIEARKHQQDMASKVRPF